MRKRGCKRKYNICLSEDIAGEYPCAVEFLESPARGKANVICALLDRFFINIGQDGYVESKAQNEFYERLINSMTLDTRSCFPERGHAARNQIYIADGRASSSYKRKESAESAETEDRVSISYKRDDSKSVTASEDGRDGGTYQNEDSSRLTESGASFHSPTQLQADSTEKPKMAENEMVLSGVSQVETGGGDADSYSEMLSGFDLGDLEPFGKE